MNTKQEQAIDGIITTFEDVLFLQGQGEMALRLRPSLQASFKEPGSFIALYLDQPGSTLRKYRF